MFRTLTFRVNYTSVVGAYKAGKHGVVQLGTAKCGGDEDLGRRNRVVKLIFPVKVGNC